MTHYYLFARQRVSFLADSEPLWDVYYSLPHPTEILQISDKYYDGTEEEYDVAWADATVFRFSDARSPLEIADSLAENLREQEDWAIVSEHGDVVEKVHGGVATTAIQKTLSKGARFTLLFLSYAEDDERWIENAERVQASMGSACRPFFYARNGRALIIGNGGSFENLKIPLNRHPRKGRTYAGVDQDWNCFLNGTWERQIWYSIT